LRRRGAPAEPSHSPRAFPRDVETAAAETRASRRAATFPARKEAAAKGRPSRVEQRQEREEGGRRGTKRPAHFDDFV
jgi:hypothetical protein